MTLKRDRGEYVTHSVKLCDNFKIMQKSYTLTLMEIKFSYLFFRLKFDI